MDMSPQARAWSWFVIVILIISLVSVIPLKTASAAEFTSRSLTLQAGVSDGGSKPGGAVNHLFTFAFATSGNVGSIKFQYCTVASGTCVTPTGLLTTSATLGSEAGAMGFSMVSTTNASPYLTRSAVNVSLPTTGTYRLDGITNPTNPNQTFFVRITTYSSTNVTTGQTDTGTVAASTATQIVLTGIMPESLVFCVGATVITTSGIPDCATATPGAINFNQLFSPTDTATASSQMAASTNAGSGYSITIHGPTLTSGGNTIAPMGIPAASIKGQSQFGLNLKLNTTATSSAAVGIEVAPSANGTNYKGQAVTGYNAVDNFKFVTTDPVADSASGGAGGTDAQIFTVSYVVNVPGSQPAGTYTTTLTYICTPTF